MGAVTPLGSNLSSSWEELMAGRDGAAPLTLFENAGCRAHQAAVCHLPDLEDVPRWKQKKLPRVSRLALPAAREALVQAGLLGPERRSTISGLALSLSTTGGGMTQGELFLRAALAGRAASQFAGLNRYQPQRQVLDLQTHLGIEGRSFVVANACASGANALGHAAEWIWSGEESCVLAGGFEALTELIYCGFDCLQALTQEKCRPFDQNRSGLLLGEAAAFLVLESEAHARARGARILCRLTGYGQATDLHHLTQPSPAGGALLAALGQAVEQAGLTRETIGYVNAHGTATPTNDGTEAAAFASFFGPAFPGVKISSTKAAIGHTLGAAGAIEALFAIQTLLTGQPPLQLNCTSPEPVIAGQLVKSGDRLKECRAVASVNLGFGGSNAALIFEA
jgi:3-oxoacyl-[acyl-carrier-protein] synthase II